MLRALVLALLLANLVYLVWVQGLLAPYGFAPASQAEPERLGQQIRPEAVELLDAHPAQPGASAPASAATPDAAASAPASAPADPASAAAPASASSAPASAPATPGAAAFVPAAAMAARSDTSTESVPVASAASKPVAFKPAASAAPASTEPRPDAEAAVAPVAVRKSASDTPKSEPEESSQCLQAGLFTEAQVSAMRPRLQASLPAGSWTFASNTLKPTRWIVYMGKYVSKEAMSKKRALLQQADVPFETPDSPQLNPGLSLGSYKTRAQAEAALARLTERGIRSAKVVPEHPELPTQWLRLSSASPAVQTKAKTLIQQISGKPLKACG